MQVKLTPRSFTTVFGLTVALLLLAHTVIQMCRFFFDDDRFHGLVFMFSVGADGNIPTFYSAFALLFSSGLLAFTGYLIRKAGRPMVLYWFGLSVIFLLMSADEMLELHERLIEPLRGALETSGAFYYAWVIPYGIAVLAIGAIYLRFLLHLPRRTAIGFIVAGAVFVTGAIGFEMLGGMIFEQGGSRNAYYVFVQTIEEMLEMVGIAMFIYAITDYIAGEFDSVTVSLEKTAPPS
jgi:hypothetical protein